MFSEDKCAGVIPQTVFQTLMHKYETERVQKAAVLPELERKAQEQLAHHQDVDRWISIIQQYTEIAALDESVRHGEAVPVFAGASCNNYDILAHNYFLLRKFESARVLSQIS